MVHQILSQSLLLLLAGLKLRKVDTVIEFF